MKKENVRQLTENELRDVNGGMTIVQGDMPPGDPNNIGTPSPFISNGNMDQLTNTDVNPEDINQPQI